MPDIATKRSEILPYVVSVASFSGTIALHGSAPENFVDFVPSAQGLARIPSVTRRDILARVGCTDMRYDLRRHGVHSSCCGSFAFVEGGHRLQAGDSPNAFNIDATYGLRAAPRLSLLATGYGASFDGAGASVFSRYRCLNAHLRCSQDLARQVTVQLEASGTLAGRNALRVPRMLPVLRYCY